MSGNVQNIFGKHYIAGCTKQPALVFDVTVYI